MEKRIKDELNVLKDIIIKTIPVARIFLFGSYASGKPGIDSDLDIYVVMRENVKIREIDAMRLIRKAIRDKKTMPADIVVGKENNFNRRKSSNTIERQIEQKGILLYG
ncbi:MAG: nucleotidyltransferase domain-containing protein [Actinobacteria bacterium]|nr:nucleotidyltransferase domain-containing protein [Actinomycetota bacterium]